MKTEATLRKARFRDVPRITELLLELRRLSNPLILNLEVNEIRMASFVRGMIGDPNHCVIVTDEVDAVIIGSLVYNFFSDDFVVREQAFIVKTPRRNLSLAKQMILALEDWGREKGAKLLVMTELAAPNSVNSFYGRLGYKATELCSSKEL